MFSSFTTLGNKSVVCLMRDHEFICYGVFRDEYCADQFIDYIKEIANPTVIGEWIDDRADVVCSHCKTSFKYDMLLYIQQGTGVEKVDGMICRCPKCGSYNRYGGDSDAES